AAAAMSADKPVGPLTVTCVKNLTDKLYEKRKTAAMDIERIVRDYQKDGKEADTRSLLFLLRSEFLESANPNTRKGGLIGLAASAIALGKEAPKYTDELFRPACDILCNDRDSRVRYYACEALYNIVKVIRASVIPHFSLLFAGLSACAQDPEATIRKGSEMLDKLLKEVVLDSSAERLSMEEFVSLAKDRMYSENVYVRQFLVSWVSTLHSSPQFNLLPFLHELLDGLLLILGDERPEIYRMTLELLDQLLGDLERRGSAEADFTGMINIIAQHCVSRQEPVRQAALRWLAQLIPLCPDTVRGHAASFLQALLPSLVLPAPAARLSELARGANDLLLGLVSREQPPSEQSVEALVSVLLHACASPPSLPVALVWLRRLLSQVPALLSRHVTSLFPVLANTLAELSAASAPDALADSLATLAALAECPELAEAGQALLEAVPETLRQRLATEHPCFVRLVHEIFKLFRSRAKLTDSGHAIVTCLSRLLTPQRVFSALALHILHAFPAEAAADSSELEAAFYMIGALSLILLTDSSLHEFRLQLHRLDNQAIADICATLYRAWCHNPAATLALCFLSRNYAHAKLLVSKFADIEITTPLLIELDKLIQLLESPIFLYVRLDLLNPGCSPDLTGCLFGLLMCLPQTEAFHQLHRRLSCLPPLHLQHQQQQPQVHSKWLLDCDPSLEQFAQIQELHRQARLSTGHSRQPQTLPLSLVSTASTIERTQSASNIR
ncbi:hypothetical protein BOX15_Mlig013528g4, partial [Macrostomum lignano]